MRVTTHLGAVALFAAASALPAGAHADIYQCRGPGGTVHYTNVRTRGMRCRTIIHDRPGPRRANASHDRVPARDHSPGRYSRYDAHIREAARLYSLPQSFNRAIMRVESDFSPNVVSEDGAMGLMQLMPKTAAAMGVLDPFDPRQNILGGARYLRILANEFNGDLVLTVAAYNAGDAAVVRYRGVPPFDETRRYVQNVLRYYYAFRAVSGSS